MITFKSSANSHGLTDTDVMSKAKVVLNDTNFSFWQLDDAITVGQRQTASLGPPTVEIKLYAWAH